jgi:2-polyprenyl-6-hydroxyphenyl methylase/3-demethylubiquinone-9 3-methyltransferase
VLRELARLGARRVVDIGAGNGAMAGRLAAAGLDLTGVEPDAGGVAAARAAWPDIVFEQAGVADDPAPIVERAGGPFDAAVCTEVVEHLYAPARLPRFAAGLLREGGHLIVTTPYHGYLKNLLLALAGCWDRHHTALWEGGHIKFWSQATLSALLEDNGFAVVRFRGAGRLPWVWKSMLLSARKTP